MTDNNTALKKAGLKVTLPRLKILEVLQEPEGHHVSAEDLYKRLIDMGEEIGLATVYRVLNQFDDAGIVTRHNFEGGKTQSEAPEVQPNLRPQSINLNKDKKHHLYHKKSYKPKLRIPIPILCPRLL